MKTLKAQNTMTKLHNLLLFFAKNFSLCLQPFDEKNGNDFWDNRDEKIGAVCLIENPTYD